MTPAATQNLDFSPPPIVQKLSQRSFMIGGLFTLGAAALAFMGSTRAEFFQAYLLGFMCWLGVSLGSMAILMIRHLTGGGWGVVVRRVMGAAMRCLPLLTVLFIPLCFGLPYLYSWDRPLDGIADAKVREHLQSLTAAYLNPHGFILRAVFYFAIWNLLSYLLSKWSAEGDKPGARDNTQRFKAVSGPGLILYGFTISFAAIDWVMSIDPSWISTIYGLQILIGEVLTAMAFTVVVERILSRYRPMSEMLLPDFVHDHGKWMLAFTMVWAYFSFSQWLIIWAGNLPDEITWYIRRINGGWGYVGVFLAAFGFAAPFVFLLSRSFKRDITKLVWLAVWILFIRYTDLLWIIEPNFSTTFRFTVSEIVVPVAIGGLWLGVFFRNLGSMPLLPLYDPSAREVLEPVHEHE